MNAVKQLAKEGINSAYLCHAVSPKKFYPESDSQTKFDICFVGNFSPWRDEVIKTALAITSNIALYGPNWLKRGNSTIPRSELASVYKGDRIVGKELNDLFNASKIVLNASRIRGSSGLNMRFFEVLAASVCFVTDAPIELERHFVRDEHLATFDTLEELKLKLEWLLGDQGARSKMAIAGYKRVMSCHTYTDMAKEVIRQYQSLENVGDIK